MIPIWPTTALRSTSCARWWAQTRHIHPWRSTSAGMCSMRKGLTHQSTQSTCAQEGNNFDFHSGGSQCCEFLGHALTNAGKHCGSTGEHNVAVEVFANIDITFHDGLEGGVMDATGLLANEAWLEEHLRAAEALATNCDDITIRQLISLLLVGTLAGGLHFCIEVQSNVAELLLDIVHNLTLSGSGE